MSLRIKLVASFLLIAMLVPILGTLAFSSTRLIGHDVQNMTNDSLPSAVTAMQLAELQDRTVTAARAYGARSQTADRERYQELVTEFDTSIAQLTAMWAERGTNPEVLAAIDADRVTFLEAGSNVLLARETVDRNLANLGVKDQEMIKELSSIRRRFVPTGPTTAPASTGAASADPPNLSPTLRNQINDLLLATEGMLRTVSLEYQLATSYAASPSDSARQQLNRANVTFNNWSRIAEESGGPEDLLLVERIKAKYREFEFSVRAMFTAADLAVDARSNFVQATDAITRTLDATVQGEIIAMTDSRSAVLAEASQQQRFLGGFTVLALLAAAGLSFGLVRIITRPIHQLRDAADQISMGNVEGVEIGIDSRDEIGELALAFRRMLVSIRILTQRQQESERPALGHDRAAS